MGTRRPRGVSRRLRFEPDDAFEWALEIRRSDPRLWATINDRAKLATHYYFLAKAAWLGQSDDDDGPAGGEAEVAD